MPNDYWLSATDVSKLDSHSRYDDLFLPGLELHLDRYNYRRSGCRFVERRTFQIQGDPLSVLHEGLLQRKRKSAHTAKNASASTQFQTEFHSVGLHFQTLIPFCFCSSRVIWATSLWTWSWLISRTLCRWDSFPSRRLLTHVSHQKKALGWIIVRRTNKDCCVC